MKCYHLARKIIWQDFLGLIAGVTKAILMSEKFAPRLVESVLILSATTKDTNQLPYVGRGRRVQRLPICQDLMVVSVLSK
jgi:hypothetical protein